MPDLDPSNGSTVERYSYLNGDNCTEVIHYKITNGNHTWPGTIFTSAGTNHDIDASIEAWNFLSKYDINGLINCGNVGVEEKPSIGNLSVYQNPAINPLQIKGLSTMDESGTLVISDLSGNIVLTSAITNGGIDVSKLLSGIYFLQIQTTTRVASIKFSKK